MDIAQLSYTYVLSMAKTKKYNPQGVAILNFFEKYNYMSIKDELEKDVLEFCESNANYIARDFVYKNDHFTPRNMYLINPLYYLYYTFTVFKISEAYLEKETVLDFSRNNMKVFYSGHLDLDATDDEIVLNSNYSTSYINYQKERLKYIDCPVLKVDLKDFFNSIKTDLLIQKLRKRLGWHQAIDDLEYFFKHCGFDSLPQLHYSIASSILSQLFLYEFDQQIENLILMEDLVLIRFVDDMYVVYLDEEMNDRRNNQILNDINHFLWKDGLGLNSSKTQFLSPIDFKYEVELDLNDYEEEKSFHSEKIIEDKVEEILLTNSLIKFINELSYVEEQKGIDLNEYKKLIDYYISINGEDSRKVLNNIIYSGKWRKIENSKLKDIVKKWKYIQFNPSQFTVLYVLVCRHLEKHSLIDGSYIKKVLKYLYKTPNFTFRDVLIIVAYLFQNKKMNEELLNKINDINKEYVEFINEYIIDNPSA